MFAQNKEGHRFVRNMLLVCLHRHKERVVMLHHRAKCGAYHHASACILPQLDYTRVTLTCFCKCSIIKIKKGGDCKWEQNLYPTLDYLSQMSQI